jgi:hypothetical protein
MLSSSWRRLMASLTVESHRCAAAMRSFSELKVWVVSTLALDEAERRENAHGWNKIGYMSGREGIVFEII